MSDVIMTADEFNEYVALKAENARLRAALAQIQVMTREFVDANRQFTKVNPTKAFWRIAHVEQIAREALKAEGE